MNFKKKESSPVKFLIGLGVLFVVIIGACIIGGVQTEDPKEMIESQFSSLDGSHYQLIQDTKAKLLDPDSFQHDETTYSISDTNDVFVMMQFRSKNTFGGYAQGVAVGLYSYTGTMLQSASMTPDQFSSSLDSGGKAFWWKPYVK